MHTADAPPSLVQGALGWYYGNQERVLAERAERDHANRAANEDVLRGDWGNEYRGNLNGVHALFDTHGAAGLAEKFFGARFADGSPVGDDPEALAFLVNVSRDINPHGTVVAAPGQNFNQAITDEIAGLENEMKDTKGVNSDYYQNPIKQERYRELISMRDRQARK